uniref:Atos homolog protein B n=1 Tax=Lepisosteus oculatus TaxID=7918 RepID=W5MAB1_LEPOC|nr:PREDICTED: protein FAM214B [Lepisosteus oculatus]XP_015218334.1 PREDICTED: protein FAM214B [Lepisosteus oculatus]XP_015218343.1 PREDICTED: protein FAM214B [Lepisosteus oculatus]XP_015218352.1 PREDICTED: protein FAM214B [Lepisosteus oculatus]XP_015218358.1 PREDICTED: protein FAM214B [Lepisosteus oculatus]
MRHIHVEIARKEAPVEVAAQEGDLPLPNAQRGGLDSGSGQGLLRPFGENEIKLQKVYQLSIFSQLGGFSDTGGEQKAEKQAVKRGLADPYSDPKRLLLPGHGADTWPDSPGIPDLPGQESELGPPLESLQDENAVVCGSGQHFSHTATCVIEHKDCASGRESGPAAGRRSLPVPLASPMARRLSEHNQDRLLQSREASISPQNPYSSAGRTARLCDASASASLPTSELDPAGEPGDGVPAQRKSGNSVAQANGALLEEQAFSNGDRRDWTQVPVSTAVSPGRDVGSEVSVELLPPEQGHSTNGLASAEKTPCSSRRPGPSSSSSPGPSSCPAKRKLLAPSDTGESCSEDEGPSTSKRSRLSLPHGVTVSCRSTDAKAAPFWNHLLPSARDRPKSSSDCTSVNRRLKSALRPKSRQLRSSRRGEANHAVRSCWPSASISRSLLGNFEESILKGRFAPSGRIEGFTAEIGASGSYCPQHATLPVEVTYYDTSEHSAPSPFLGVIHLEPLGKKGYSVPKAGTIQVTLFNPNKTVVKMFLVTYNFGDMPVNHITFLRHRIFLVPVEEGEGQDEQSEAGAADRKRILCYLIHLRFQSSKSGKIYLHDDIRLLFSRKSIEVDTGIPYELKSFTEVPRNPTYSPRV